MLIALDYDGVITENGAFWLRFIEMARGDGHEVICVTGRHKLEKDAGVLAFKRHMKFYFTGGRAKREFMDEQNIKPDVWIDDNPYFIVNDAE